MLRVWDVLSGKQLHQTSTGEDVIWCAAALWGDRVATGHSTGEIRLWSLGGGGGAAGVLRGHSDQVFSLAVVGGGTAQRLLASGSDDHSVRLWDVDAGSCTAVLSGHTNFVRCLADLGGGQLLSGSGDRSLRVWNTATGACLAVLPNAHGEGAIYAISAACALPGGAATGSYGGSVKHWKWDESSCALTPDGAELWPEGGTVFSLAASQGPDGTLQLIASSEEDVFGFFVQSTGRALQQQTELTGHSNTVNAVAVMMAAAQLSATAARIAGGSSAAGSAPVAVVAVQGAPAIL